MHRGLCEPGTPDPTTAAGAGVVLEDENSFQTEKTCLKPKKEMCVQFVCTIDLSRRQTGPGTTPNRGGEGPAEMVLKVMCTDGNTKLIMTDHY